MVALVQHLNTNASEHRKPSAILPLAQYHPNIARSERRKFVKSRPSEYLFLKKSKYVMMRRKRFA